MDYFRPQPPRELEFDTDTQTVARFGGQTALSCSENSKLKAIELQRRLIIHTAVKTSTQMNQILS